MKKKLLVILCCALFLNLKAQKGFYDLDAIQEIKIEFGYTGWHEKMVAQKAGAQNYILAASCTINGVKFDSVGVKYKGNSSYKSTNKKNPLHIKLDWAKSQSYNGVASIKLSNIYADPSYIREALSYKLLGNYMDCPRANFAKVSIEGNYYGFMTNVEPINNKFLSNHFNSSDNTFIKCNPKFGGGQLPSGNNVPNLSFLGTDTTKYVGKYEIQSETGWKDLMIFCDSLNNKPASLPKILDIDRALWMLAFNNVFVNLDSYTGAFAQNYYLYKDDNGRFLPIVWDLNMSFGSFTLTGGTTQGSLTQLAYDLHKTNGARPLIKNLLSNATYERMYVAHMRTMLKDWFVNKAYETEAKTIRDFIDPEVKTDVGAFATYTQFQAGMNAIGGIGGIGQNVIGIATLMNGRTNYLTALPAFTAEPPALSNNDFSPKSALKGDKIVVTVKAQDAKKVFVNYREDGDDIFEKIEMFDDGQHQDVAANDGIFGASLTVKDLKMQYYFYAENDKAGIFAPERAEHEFYTLKLQNAGQSSVAVGDLVINEIMAANKKTAKDPSDNKFEDWLELYNNSTKSISLDNLYLTDDYTKKDKWQFPKGVTIPAKGRIIVWLDGDDKVTQGIHTSFKLSASGEEIMVAKADGTVLDSISYKTLADDESLERCPDGTGKFAKTLKPTFNAENCKPLGINDFSQLPDFQLFPNPTQSILYVTGEALRHIEIINTFGQVVLSKNYDNESQISFSLDIFPKGIYLVRVNDGRIKRIVLQ